MNKPYMENSYMAARNERSEAIGDAITVIKPPWQA